VNTADLEEAMAHKPDSSSVQLGPTRVRFLVEAADSNETHTVQEITVSPEGAMPVPHSHDGFEETFIGLTGVTTVTIDGAEHEIGPGEAICIRRGQVHAFRNHGADEVRFVAVAAPGIFGRTYFEEMAEAFESFGAGPPNPAVLGEIMRRHGLTPVRPT
jgi:quercetin dioxygenase-like cupin family protein